MTLARADLLWLGMLAAGLLCLAVMLQARRLDRLRRGLGDRAERLLPVRRMRIVARLFCVTVGAGAIGSAAAGVRPRTPELLAPSAPLDLVIAVDLSLSMTADDVEPSRLARARAVVTELTSLLPPSTRVALVVFADWPYTLVPLTDDVALVRWFVRSLSAEAVPERHQGTSLALAIETARSTLDARRREEARRAVLLLTDGGAHDARDGVLASASAADEAGTGVWVGGLGTTRGAGLGSAIAPIVDPRGMPVVAALDADLLRAIASVGGGSYEDVSSDEGARALASALVESTRRSGGEASGELAVTLWLTLLALGLLLWEGALDRGRGLPGGQRA